MGFLGSLFKKKCQACGRRPESGVTLVGARHLCEDCRNEQRREAVEKLAEEMENILRYGHDLMFGDGMIRRLTDILDLSPDFDEARGIRLVVAIRQLSARGSTVATDSYKEHWARCTIILRDDIEWALGLDGTKNAPWLDKYPESGVRYQITQDFFSRATLESFKNMLHDWEEMYL